MSISKLKIVDRSKRIVEYSDESGATRRAQLKMERTCNAGDVQKLFNFEINQKRPEDAVKLLERKSEALWWTNARD